MDRTNRNEDKPSRIESQQNPPTDSRPTFRYKGQSKRDAIDFSKPSARGCVYFIRCGEYVKIGYSINPLQRLTDLQTGMPYRLEILASEWGTPFDPEMTFSDLKQLKFRCSKCGSIRVELRRELEMEWKRRIKR